MGANKISMYIKLNIKYIFSTNKSIINIFENNVHIANGLWSLRIEKRTLQSSLFE